MSNMFIYKRAKVAFEMLDSCISIHSQRLVRISKRIPNTGPVQSVEDKHGLVVFEWPML